VFSDVVKNTENKFIAWWLDMASLSLRAFIGGMDQCKRNTTELLFAFFSS